MILFGRLMMGLKLNIELYFLYLPLDYSESFPKKSYTLLNTVFFINKNIVQPGADIHTSKQPSSYIRNDFHLDTGHIYI